MWGEKQPIKGKTIGKSNDFTLFMKARGNYTHWGAITSNAAGKAGIKCLRLDTEPAWTLSKVPAAQVIFLGTIPEEAWKKSAV